MTIEQLEDELPNGFHDSFLVSVTVDFSAGTGCIELDVDYDDPDPNMFRRMKLKLRGLSLFIAEPPQFRQEFSLGGREWIEGCVTTQAELPGLESYRQTLPAGCFFYSFLLRNWNCFIHLAAQDAELVAA